MRKRVWLAALVTALGAGRVAHAQQFGPVIGPLQFQVVGTDDSKLPISGPTLTSTKTTLSNFFSSIAHLNTKPVANVSSQFPTPAQLPDKNYFKAFRMQRPQRITP
jgi:hypothetical protein